MLAVRESADAVWARRDADGLWTQRLYGVEPHRGLNPPHGVVGNVAALVGLLNQILGLLTGLLGGVA